ncbi:MAG: GGDEF domain-containing protein [Clostridia bacterium]|nr:GGDEF domain-containing protein [Clostridia bacterium]
MLDWIRNFREQLFGEDVPIKTKFFNIVCVGAPFFSLLATLANLISGSTAGDNSNIGIWACIICTVTCLSLYPLSKVIKNVDVLIGLVAFGMNFLIMPLLYITLGGIKSSMTLYFVVAVVFSVLMLNDTKKAGILVTFAFIWYALLISAEAQNWFGLADLTQSLVVYHGNEYLDTILDLIVCSLCIAILVKVLARNFEAQQLRSDKLLAQMEELSVKDPLTGAYNRRFLIRYLESSIATCRADNRSIAIVMFDIDKFKRINDDYGHLVGDEVIKAVADILKKSCRDYDIVSRYGGEEFILVMPGATENTAISRANEIREKFGAMKVAPEIDRPVTISGGVAELSVSIKTTEDFIKVADDNLYVAKETGRNKIVGATYNKGIQA